MPNDVETEVLKERVKHLESSLKEHLEEDARRLTSIEKKVDELLLTVARYRGVIGGLILAATAMGAIITQVINYFIGRS